MTGNIRFFSFDEVLKYIDNIDREPLHEISIRQKKTTPETVATWLKRHCEFEFTEDHDAYLDAVLGSMNKYQLERLFLKNNLFAMLGTPTIKELFEQCFDRSFMNSDKPTEANKEAIETLNEYFEYFLSYPYQWDDKERHIADMRRKCVIISDTDSTFLNIDPVVEWYERELNGGERLDKIGRIAVCNVMVYAITKFVEKIFWQLTKNMNIPEDRRKLINMKSEFNYSRIILTKNKKQYAGIIVLQEGNLLEKPKFDIKGLDIKKVKTPKIARKYFGEVLEKDMLLCDQIDPMSVFMKFIKFERQIYDSLTTGQTSFLKPSKFGSEDGYKKPGQIQAYRGVRLWNAMFPRKTIPDFSNVNLLKLRKITPEDYKDHFPQEWHEAVEAYFDYQLPKIKGQDSEDGEKKVKTCLGDYGIDVIAIPKGEEAVPEVFRDLIDTTNIIDANMKNGNILLESIGFKVVKSLKQDTITNIVEV